MDGTRNRPSPRMNPVRRWALVMLASLLAWALLIAWVVAVWLWARS